MGENFYEFRGIATFCESFFHEFLYGVCIYSRTQPTFPIGNLQKFSLKMLYSCQFVEFLTHKFSGYMVHQSVYAHVHTMYIHV